MGEITVFECDVTGDRFGARNDVFEIGVKRRSPRNPFDVTEYDLHISDRGLDEGPDKCARLTTNVEYVAFDAGDREIIGYGVSVKSDSYSTGRHVEYRERGDAVGGDRYEPLFAWLESEVIV